MPEGAAFKCPDRQTDGGEGFKPQKYGDLPSRVQWCFVEGYIYKMSSLFFHSRLPSSLLHILDLKVADQEHERRAADY